MDQTFSVHVVDDDAGVRESTKALLLGAGYDVHCHVSAEQFLERCTDGYGCALIDLRMSGMDGLDLQKEMIARKSRLSVIFMSAYGDITKAVEAMRMGAVDFLQKPFDPDHLLRRIAGLTDTSINTHEQMHRSARQQAALIDTLTPRERQVLRGIVDGLANKQVAGELGISARTVETHRVHIMQKLQADSLAHLVRIWLQSSQYAEAPTG